MEIVKDGDLGGEESGSSTHPPTVEAGFSASEAVNQMAVSATGWSAAVFVSSVLS
jgi:hypothetical protein